MPITETKHDIRYADVRFVIEYVPIASLIPSPNQTRHHPKAKLKKLERSLTDYGFIIPLRVNAENVVLGGNATLAAALALGLIEVPVIRVEHLSPAAERLYAIAENKLAEGSTWELGKLFNEFQAIERLAPSIDLTTSAWAMPEIDGIYRRIRTAEEADLEEPVPVESPTKSISRIGDLFILGNHRLLCGDATMASTIALVCGDRQVRVVISDLPFNVKISGHVSGLGKTKHREFSQASGELNKAGFTEWLARAIAAMKPSLLPGGLLYLFMDWRHMAELLAAAEQEGLDQRNLLVWAKTNAGMGSHYRSAHELIGLFKYGEDRHVNNVQLGTFGRYRTNVLTYPGMNTFAKGRNKALKLHPTVKPTALIADLILDSSNAGDLILDSFGGSGTTLIAAEKMGRHAALVEIDPEYVDVCIQRWEELTGQQAILASTGQTFGELAAERSAEVRDAA